MSPHEPRETCPVSRGVVVEQTHNIVNSRGSAASTLRVRQPRCLLIRPKRGYSSRKHWQMRKTRNQVRVHRRWSPHCHGCRVFGSWHPMRETSHAIVGTRRCETAERTTDPSTASRKNELDIHQLPCETRRSLPHPETLFHLCFTEVRRPGEGEENDLLAGYGADVMVYGQDFDASDLLDHRLHDWTVCFDQLGPHLLE